MRKPSLSAASFRALNDKLAQHEAERKAARKAKLKAKLKAAADGGHSSDEPLQPLPPPAATPPLNAAPESPIKSARKTHKKSQATVPAKTVDAADFDFSDDEDDALSARIVAMEAAAVRRFGKYSKKWPQELWNIIVKHIDDDLLGQMRGVRAPNVRHLLTEIRHAVAAATAKPAGYYRALFHEAKMEPHGDTATLQLYLAKFENIIFELEKEKQAIPPLERNQVFLDGLAPPFALFAQSCTTQGSPGYSWNWEELIAATRAHALKKSVAPLLLQFDKRPAKGATPASIFYAKTGTAPQEGRKPKEKLAELCRNHSQGKCNLGSSCRFTHAGPTHDQVAPRAPGGPSAGEALKFCVHCRKINHLKADCHSFKKGEAANTTRPLPPNLESRAAPRPPVQMHPAVADALLDNQFYFELAAVTTDFGDLDNDVPLLVGSSDDDSSSSDESADCENFNVTFFDGREATSVASTVAARPQLEEKDMPASPDQHTRTAQLSELECAAARDVARIRQLAQAHPHFTSNLSCRGWPRPTVSGAKPSRVKQLMTRLDSTCTMCHVDFKYSEQHEDHDDSLRHFQVWSHYYYRQNPDFCGVCHVVPECPELHAHKADGRHARNLRRHLLGAHLSATPPLRLPTQDESMMTAETFFLPSNQSVGDKSKWVADTGATRSATHSAAGLYNEIPCRIHVAGVGGGFFVTRAGLMDIPVQLHNGVADTITISVLVHESFPLNLLSLPDLIQRRGDFVFGADTFTQLNPLRDGEQGKIAGYRCKVSRLYILSQPTPQLLSGVDQSVSTLDGGPSGGGGGAAAPRTERQHLMAAFHEAMTPRVIFGPPGPPSTDEACMYCCVEVLVAKTY